MMLTENRGKERRKGKAAVVADANSCAGRECTRSCGTCNVSQRVVESRSCVDRCVIIIPSHSIEVPVFFKAWIYGEPEHEIKEEPQNKPKEILDADAVHVTESV